jgi:hypothetical protein
MLCASIVIQVQAQSISNTDFQIDENAIYNSARVGGFVAAMLTCYKKYKTPEYLEIYEKTLPLINKMQALERNKAMENFMNVSQSGIFEYLQLTQAECQRIVSKDWQQYLLQ